MRRSLLSLALALVLLPSTAQAAPLTAVTKTSLAGGPAVGAGTVVWLEGEARRSLRLRQWSLTGGAIATPFAQARAIEGGDLFGFDPMVSPTRVAFGAREFLAVDPNPATAYSVVRTAAPGGAFAVSAGDLDGKTLVASADLSGDVLATVETATAGVANTVYVRDLAAGGAPRQIGPTGALGVRVAGPYLAVATLAAPGAASGTVVVLDRVTGAEVYRVPVPLTAPYAYGFGFDLQADGTLGMLVANAQSTGGRPLQDVAWASIAEPRLHVVATGADPTLVRITANRILFVRGHDASSAELALADLNGTITRASFPVPAINGGDFDGTHVAFSTGSCIYAGDLPDAQAAAAPPLGTCPQMAVSVDTIGRTAASRLRVGVGCHMAPASGCVGTARVRTARRPITVGTAHFRVLRGTTAELRVNVSSRTLRALRRRVSRKRKTIAVVLGATTVDAAGLTSQSLRYRFRLRIKP